MVTKYKIIKRLVLALTTALVFSGVAAKELPLEYFTKSGDYLDISLSPDAKHYAARAQHENSVVVVVVRLSDHKIVGGVKAGKNNEIHQVFWVSNNRLVYTLAERNRWLDSPTPTGELYAVNIDKTQHEQLAGFRAGSNSNFSHLKSKENEKSTFQILNLLPEDEKHILVVQYPWSKSGYFYYDWRNRAPVISKMNVFTGRQTNKETIPFAGAHVFSDDAGNVRFATWSDEDAETNVMYRENKESKWKKINETFDIEFKAVKAVAVSKDGSKLFLSGRQKEGDAETIFEFDIKTKKLEQIFDNELDLSHWFYDENGVPVVGVSYPGKVKYHYSNTVKKSKIAKAHRGLVKAFGGQEVEIVSFDKSSTMFTIKSHSDINPGEYFLYDTQSKKAQSLWTNYSWVDINLMSKVEPFTFDARDGTKISGYLTLPKGTVKDGQMPMVVLPHGGPHGVRDYPHFNFETQLLANRGYIVMQVNFRGSGGYNHQFQKAGYTEWGGKMIDDVIDATQWAIKQGYANQNRVCIYGASYGAFSALMSAVKSPKQYQCAIGYVGIYDLPVMFGKGDIPKMNIGEGYLKRALGEDMEKLAEQSPVNHADKIEAAVMLIHGKEDNRAPIYHAKVMKKAMKKAGKPVEWLVLKNAGHGAGSQKNKNKVYSQLLKFLDKNIGKNSNLKK